MPLDYEAFGNFLPRSREVDWELDLVEPHLIERIAAPQAHPTPNKVSYPQGPFPAELLREPEVVVVRPAFNEDGSDFAPGATAQNNFKPPRYLRCGSCMMRVLETETANHVCEE